MRRLAFNASILAAGGYVAQAASVLTYVLAARTLGPDTFGALSGAIGVAALVAGFCDFGMNGWAIRAIARRPSEIEVFKQTLTAKLTLAVLCTLAWVGISVTILGHQSLQLPIVLLAGYLLTLVVSGTLTVPFRASENMTVVSIVGTAEKAVTLGVWLAVQSLGAIRAEVLLPVALLAGGSASIICAAIFIPRRFLTIGTPSLRQVFRLLHSSYSFGIVGASAGILKADVAVVSALAGSHAAGVYAAPARLTTFLAILPASFSAAVFPRFVRSAALGTSRRREIIATTAMLVIITLLLAAVAFLAPVLIAVALGPAYLSSVLVLRIYLLAVLINAANQTLLALLQAEGYEHYAARVIVASALLGLLTIGAGAYLAGAVGAAVGAVLLQLFQIPLFVSKALISRNSKMGARASEGLSKDDLHVTANGPAK